MNIKEATELIEKEKKELQSAIDKLLSEFEEKGGVSIASMQLMRMGETDSEKTIPCVLIILEL